MICKKCNNQFDFNDGLKFCPYCGERIDDYADLESGHSDSEEAASQDEKKKNIHDTLEMPIIKDKDIKQYRRTKLFNSIKQILFRKRVAIPITMVMIIGILAVLGYKFLLAEPVDTGRIKEDLVGKTITLAKGTKFDIKQEYIKALKINSRNTDKHAGKDQINASITLNNGTIEVKAILTLLYIYEGKNEWKFDGKIGISKNVAVRPVAPMNESIFLAQLKSFNIAIDDFQRTLGDEDVKSLKVSKRSSSIDNGKEEIIVNADIDNGIVAADGEIKCLLNFKDEKWQIDEVKRNKEDDFKLKLSSAFSESKLLKEVKEEGLNETVAYQSIFGGTGFYVKDDFTKDMSVVDKKFDSEDSELTVTVKRENTAGVLKTTLLTNYTFDVSLNNITFKDKTKTEVQKVDTGTISKDMIVSTFTNANLEGGNIIFWWTNNHQITAEEASTFELDTVLSKKDIQNIKYVYGKITYTDGSSEKTSNLVAIYNLNYDASQGYAWKLDRIISDESSDYETYSKDKIEQ